MIKCSDSQVFKCFDVLSKSKLTKRKKCQLSLLLTIWHAFCIIPKLNICAHVVPECINVMECSNISGFLY